MKLPTSNVVGPWSHDFSHTQIVLHTMFRTCKGHYIGIPTSRVSILKLGCICAVPSADAVAIGGVSGERTIRGR